jgi:C_GCAxxG_C_C family probable redox protein
LRENGFLEVSEDVIKASTPLGAGLGFAKEVCGCLTGGALALGLKYGRTDLTMIRRPSWSRAVRLVERFKDRYGTTSCAEMTRVFSDFSSPQRIARCMEIIAFTTCEVVGLLFDSDETYKDPEKDAYFARRELR